jgi:RimJ/RimL family protein N-acetyltransferase
LTTIVAIKRPTANHLLEVFRKANEGAMPGNFSLELGWAYTVDSYRGKGICNELVQAILKVETENLFATTRCDNLPMQKILNKNGFKVIGKPYESDGDYSLLLFTKEK